MTPAPIESWRGCREILCLRPDNMGDLLMTVPALRALKETFDCRITLLGSPESAPLVPHVAEIDASLTWNAPWSKGTPAGGAALAPLADTLRRRRFDAAVIFTVCSQNPLPAAMLTYQAGIPRRLAYCRENPYALLTDWIPDPEPFTAMRHQVRRDLNLVRHIGAATQDETLSLRFPARLWAGVAEKLKARGLDPGRPWVLLHPGVSEERRTYSESEWIEAGRELTEIRGVQIAVTGSRAERLLAERLCVGIGPGAICLAGDFSFVEFLTVVEHAPLVLTVNTLTAHVAAAARRPVIVLYAWTNPQHPPWNATGRLLAYPPNDPTPSRNEIVRLMQAKWRPPDLAPVTGREVAAQAAALLDGRGELIPELAPLRVQQIV